MPPFASFQTMVQSGDPEVVLQRALLLAASPNSREISAADTLVHEGIRKADNPDSLRKFCALNLSLISEVISKHRYQAFAKYAHQKYIELQPALIEDHEALKFMLYFPSLEQIGRRSDFSQLDPKIVNSLKALPPRETIELLLPAIENCKYSVDRFKLFLFLKSCVLDRPASPENILLLLNVLSDLRYNPAEHYALQNQTLIRLTIVEPALAALVKKNEQKAPVWCAPPQAIMTVAQRYAELHGSFALPTELRKAMGLADSTSPTARPSDIQLKENLSLLASADLIERARGIENLRSILSDSSISLSERRDASLRLLSLIDAKLTFTSSTSTSSAGWAFNQVLSSDQKNELLLEVLVPVLDDIRIEDKSSDLRDFLLYTSVLPSAGQMLKYVLDHEARNFDAFVSSFKIQAPQKTRTEEIWPCNTTILENLDPLDCPVMEKLVRASSLSALSTMTNVSPDVAMKARDQSEQHRKAVIQALNVDEALALNAKGLEQVLLESDPKLTESEVSELLRQSGASPYAKHLALETLTAKFDSNEAKRILTSSSNSWEDHLTKTVLVWGEVSRRRLRGDEWTAALREGINTLLEHVDPTKPEHALAVISAIDTVGCVCDSPDKEALESILRRGVSLHHALVFEKAGANVRIRNPFLSVSGYDRIVPNYIAKDCVEQILFTTNPPTFLTEALPYPQQKQEFLLFFKRWERELEVARTLKQADKEGLLFSNKGLDIAYERLAARVEFVAPTSKSNQSENCETLKWLLGVPLELKREGIDVGIPDDAVTKAIPHLQFLSYDELMFFAFHTDNRVKEAVSQVLKGRIPNFPENTHSSNRYEDEFLLIERKLVGQLASARTYRNDRNSHDSLSDFFHLLKELKSLRLNPSVLLVDEVRADALQRAPSIDEHDETSITLRKVSTEVWRWSRGLNGGRPLINIFLKSGSEPVVLAQSMNLMLIAKAMS